MTLPDQKITLNAICPGFVRTNIATGAFHDEVDRHGLLVPMDSIMDSIESLLGASQTSGEAIEVLPGKDGWRIKERDPYTNEKCKESIEMT